VVVLGAARRDWAPRESRPTRIERAGALLAEAKKLGMTIIGVHVEARPGAASCPTGYCGRRASCQYLVVVADGDKDGFITRLAGAAIPLDKVERISKAANPSRRRSSRSRG